MSDTQDAALGLAIRDMREFLLNSGYTHGRRAGELVGHSPDGVEIYVRTGYTLGSYRILAYGRVNGTKQGLHFLDVNRGVDDARVREIRDALASWSGAHWPPHPDMQAATVEQGDGWPPK